MASKRNKVDDDALQTEGLDSRLHERMLGTQDRISKRNKVDDDALQTEGLNFRLHERMLGTQDRISKLPDEILISILSFLSFKEAMIASVVSTRWNNLCVSSLRLTRRLDFDASKWLLKVVRTAFLEKVCPPIWREEAKLVDRVNKLLLVHKAPTLKLFRVCFDIGIHHEGDMHKWLRFALARRVERLEMSFLPFGVPSRVCEKCCALPAEIFTPTDVSMLGRHFSYRDGIESLIDLTLKCVDVSDENLHFLLSNCPNLERLTVHGSMILTDVNIYRPHPALRHLDISHCDHVNSITLRDTNLISFSCVSGTIYFIRLYDNLYLLEVNFGYIPSLTSAFRMLSSYLSRLEVLTLHLLVCRPEYAFVEYPELTRLKRLVLEDTVVNERSVMGFAALLKASPCLQEFTFKILRMPCEKKRVASRHVACPHTNLKVAVVQGYYGGTSAYEVVTYLLHNAVALEELIIDSRDPFLLDKLHTHRFITEGKARRDLAKQHFEGKVRSEIKLSII